MMGAGRVHLAEKGLRKGRKVIQHGNKVTVVNIGNYARYL